MKKNWDWGRKFWQHVQVFCLIVGLSLVSQARADVGNTFVDGVFSYTVLTEDAGAATGTVSIAKNYYNPPTGNLVIPSTVVSDGITYSITTIEYAAFYDCTEVTSLTIGDHVEIIGGSAFYNCSGVTSLTIGDHVESIGDSAFRNCSALTSIVIPDNVTELELYVFSGCSSLANVEIGAGVATMSPFIFSSCYNLLNFIVSEDNPSLLSLDGVLYDKAGETLLLFPRGRTGEYQLPLTVTSVDGRAFLDGNGLTQLIVEADNPHFTTQEGILFNKLRTSLILCPGEKEGEYVVPDSVTQLETNAFAGCTKLTGVILPEGLVYIGNQSFNGCSGLTELTIPESVTTILDAAFAGCSGLTSIVIPDAVTTLSGNLFENCSGLTNVVLPQGVTELSHCLFAECISLTQFIIPETVTYIASHTFLGCTGLTEIIIPGTVSEIGSHAFYNCLNLKNVIINEGVSQIGRCVFTNCRSLTSVTIPDSVTTLGDMLFTHCTSLTDVIIPAGITTLGDWTFYSCKNLIHLFFKGDAPSITGDYYSSLFWNSPYVTVYYVEGTEGWTNPWQSVPTTTWVPDTPPTIEVQPATQTVLLGCTVVLNVTAVSSDPMTYQWYKEATPISDAADATYTITGITTEDFGVYTVEVTNKYGSTMSNPAILTIGERTGDPDSDFEYSVQNNTATITKYIGSNTQVVIPNYVENTYRVTAIGDNAFNGQSTLTNITIPDTVLTLGNYVFHSCSGLTSMIIPESVSTLGINVFSSCSGLTSMLIPESVSTLGRCLFSSCKGLTNVTLPQNITEIPDSMFSGCKSLASIEIPENVLTIGISSFANCISLTSIVIPDNVTSIGNSAFCYCSKLENIIIGENVSSLGSMVFWYPASPASVYFKGDAPTVQGKISISQSTTVYYLEGTTGWTNPWAGCPTEIWNPVNEEATLDFEQEGNFLILSFTGTLQQSTDMVNWEDVSEAVTPYSAEVLPGENHFYRSVVKATE